MKKIIYIAIAIIFIAYIILLIYFINENNNDNNNQVAKLNNTNNTVEYNVINETINSESEILEEMQATNVNNTQEQITNNVVSDNYSNKPVLNKQEKEKSKKETVVTPKEETKIEVQEQSKQEEIKEETKEEIEQPQEDTTPKESTQQLDFSKYDRYYPALNGGYTCFKKNDTEIAKLKELIEDTIKEFGYENVTIREDSSIISNRYFTANKTNVQNVVYNSDYFTILYYAETEYGLTKDGNERIMQIRSYTKVIGQ